MRIAEFGEVIFEFVPFVFGYVDPSTFHYVHLAPSPDPHAHNVFVVDGDRAALDGLRRPLRSLTQRADRYDRSTVRPCPRGTRHSA